jgi:hypothetical protein
MAAMKKNAEEKINLILNKPITRLALSDGKYLQVGFGEKHIKKNHTRKADDFYTEYELCSYSGWRFFSSSKLIQDSVSLKSKHAPDFKDIYLDFFHTITVNEYGDLNLYSNNGHFQLIKNISDSVAILFFKDDCIHEF